MNDEARRAPRRTLDINVQVIDMMTDKPMGRISNISATGMLLVTHTPTNDNALYQLRFACPKGGAHEVDCEVGVNQVWQQPAETPGMYWVGAHFIAISEQDIACLQQWIDAGGG